MGVSSVMPVRTRNRLWVFGAESVKRSLEVVVGVGVAGTLVLTAMVGADEGRASSSAGGASRVIDRTFLCTNAAQAGWRGISAGATSGFRDAGTWKWIGSAGMANSGITVTRLRSGGTADTHWGVGVAAGAGRIARDPSVPRTEPRLIIWSRWAKACTPASPKRVPLVGQGLSGGIAGYFGDRFKCTVPRRVYVRVRAVFAEPATLRLDRASGQLVAAGDVKDGLFAARSESGRPLVFAAVSGKGKARIFTAPACFPD
jgi:hypothetical protein